VHESISLIAAKFVSDCRSRCVVLGPADQHRSADPSLDNTLADKDLSQMQLRSKGCIS
jgi:hypothetical protein